MTLTQNRISKRKMRQNQNRQGRFEPRRRITSFKCIHTMTRSIEIHIYCTFYVHNVHPSISSPPRDLGKGTSASDIFVCNF